METWSDMLLAKGEARGMAQGVAKGLAEGEARGMAKGQAAIFLALIEEKFGPADDTVRDRVRSADSDHLLAWAKRLLSARRLDEVFDGTAH